MTLSATAPARLSVDLDAVIANYRLCRSMTQALTAAVIKADGYGVGLRPAFRALRQAGCRDFFVATPDEALTIRAEDEQTRLFVLEGAYPGSEGLFAARGIIPVLNTPGALDRWARQARQSGRPLPAALHIDTGMNRLGMDEADAMALLSTPERLTGLSPCLLMSHFACSDEKSHPMNEVQAARFAALSSAFPGYLPSLCNSSGLFRNPGWHHGMVRPGFALFGGNPTPETTNPMRRVVDLSVRILQTRQGKKGETIGYNASETLSGDTRLATVALGYADGFLRSGGGKARLFRNGHPCRVLGRVSMDLIVVDLGQHPAQEDEWLEVLGPHQSVDDLARDCDTIGYEILTSLSRRAHRHYTGAGA